MTMRAIALRLTEERILTAMDRGHRGGGPRKRVGVGIWHRSTVHAIIRNSRYAGTTALEKRKTLTTAIVPTANGVKLRPHRVGRPPEQWIHVPVPAIIDAADWQAAQVQMARNKALSFRHMRPGRIYLLRSRWFRCGRCGLGMAAFWQHERGYYRCSSHHERMDPAARCRGTVRGEDVEGRIWNAIMSLLENPDLVAREVAKQRETVHAAEAEIDQELATIAACLERCEQDDRRLVDAYVVGAFTPQELKAYRAEVTTRRQGLDARRQELLAKHTGLRETTDRREALNAYCARVRERLYTFTVVEKHVLFDALALKLFWTPGELLHLEATIPLDGDGIVSNTPKWTSPPQTNKC
jgi:site-specific DNA recombinase